MCIFRGFSVSHLADVGAAEDMLDQAAFRFVQHCHAELQEGVKKFTKYADVSYQKMRGLKMDIEHVRQPPLCLRVAFVVISETA